MTGANLVGRARNGVIMSSSARERERTMLQYLVKPIMDRAYRDFAGNEYDVEKACLSEGATVKPAPPAQRTHIPRRARSG
jgi:hypothetical protein